MSEAIKTSVDGHVLNIIIDRPPANAFDVATTQEIYAAFVRLRDDPELRVGLITGTGDRIFSGGWDLKATAAGAEPIPTDNPDPVRTLPEMDDLYKPVIAAVNGYAVGGGFELALGADLIIAADHAEFFLPEMQRGFVPEGGALQILSRQLPYRVFMDLMLTGRRLGADEAMQWGLVKEVVPLGELMPRARAIAQEVADNAPLALQALKQYLQAVDGISIADSFALTRDVWAKRSGLHFCELVQDSEDMMEGIKAFAEKRKPVWKGK